MLCNFHLNLKKKKNSRPCESVPQTRAFHRQGFLWKGLSESSWRLPGGRGRERHSRLRERHGKSLEQETTGQLMGRRCRGQDTGGLTGQAEGLRCYPDGSASPEVCLMRLYLAAITG